MKHRSRKYMMQELGSRMRLLIPVVMSALLSGGPLLLAQGGALPKGTYKGTAAPKGPIKTVPKKQTKATGPACSERIYLAGEASGSFSKDGSYLYLLARNKGGGKLPRYTLFKVDPEQKKAEAVYGLEQKGDVALMLLNDPVQAVSTVSFIGNCSSMYEGPAGSVTVSLDKKNEKAIQVSGDFVLMDTPSGRNFSDMKKNQILEMDALSFQTKLSARYAKGERPIFFDAIKKYLVVWHHDKKQRGLIAYFNEASKPGAALAIPEWDKLLRDHDKFGAYTPITKGNKVIIHEVPDWSGVNEKKDFTLKVSPDIRVGSAALVVNFASRLVAFVGPTWISRSANNKVYLYNYQTGKLLGRITPGSGDVPGFVGISTDGKFLMVEIKSASGKHTSALKVMRVDTGFVESIKLNFQK